MSLSLYGICEEKAFSKDSQLSGLTVKLCVEALTGDA